MVSNYTYIIERHLWGLWAGSYREEVVGSTHCWSYGTEYDRWASTSSVKSGKSDIDNPLIRCIGQNYVVLELLIPILEGPYIDIRACLDVMSTHILITSTIQTLRPQKDTTQKFSDHVTLRPKIRRNIRPPKVVTLRPHKVGHCVTV